MSVLLNVISYGIQPKASFATAFANYSIVKKLVDLVKSLFNTVQWAFVNLYGTKEILFDRVKDLRYSKKNIIKTHATRVNSYLNRVFVKKNAFIGPINFNVAHGSLYMASGLAGSLAAIHQQGWLNIGCLAAPLETLGNGLFGLASLVALIHNVKIYRAAAQVPEYAPTYAKEAASMLKKSAVCGIISSLNYIIASALLIFGAAFTFALVFGCIAVVSGCFKILYDFIRFKNAY